MASSKVAPSALLAAILGTILLISGHIEQNRKIEELTRQLTELASARGDGNKNIIIDLDNLDNGQHELAANKLRGHEKARAINRDIQREYEIEAEGSSAHDNHRALSTTTNATSCTPPSSFTYAADYGVVGDSMANDGPALQAAIDAAASDNSGGGIVVLPPGVFITLQPLLIPGGVTLQGQGYGSSPLAIQFDAGGTTIAYCGTDHAVQLVGHGAGLEDLAVYDWPYNHGEFDGGCPEMKASGGVLVKADNRLVESVRLSNVFIYYFVGGAALSLVATNNGGIGYGNFHNVRMRHAKTGVFLSADDIGTGSNDGKSFVNTNSWIGGSISGGGFTYGIHATGPGDCNDNKFYGTSIGMPDSEVAHVYVTGSTTNVKLQDIRLEASEKSLDKPIVIVDDSSYGNKMNGILGHTHIQANLNRNPEIDFMSHKSVGLDPVPMNQFWNDGFKGSSLTSRPNWQMPGWKLEGTNVVVTVLDSAEELYPDHLVLHVDKLSFGGPFKMMSDQTLLVPGHDFVTFGVYARSSVQGSISAAMRYTSGSIIASGSHSGSGKWEFIGMTALYDKTAPYFYFSITGDVDVTAPTLTFGQTPATPGAALLSSSGARMSGTFSAGMAIGKPPPPEAYPHYWVLPKNEGNVFLMDMEGNPLRHIIRLNDKGADRFPRGTVITLWFEEAGTRVQSNAYIKLKNDEDFVSVLHSSITLMTQGSASWYEVSRNN